MSIDIGHNNTTTYLAVQGLAVSFKVCSVAKNSNAELTLLLPGTVVKLAPDPLCTIPSYKTAKIQVLNLAAQRPTRTMPFERVLICGAGVAGSILAYWLAKHDFQVVVVERSKTEQTA